MKVGASAFSIESSDRCKERLHSCILSNDGFKNSQLMIMAVKARPHLFVKNVHSIIEEQCGDRNERKRPGNRVFFVLETIS